MVFKHRALASPQNCTTTKGPESISQKLRDSVMFLPLKDLHFANQLLDGHTWYMSSMYDKREVQHQQFPSNSSKGRLLCLKGRDTHDGSWNHYALAWPEALPSNATLMKGLTFVHITIITLSITSGNFRRLASEEQLRNPDKMGALQSGRAEVQHGDVVEYLDGCYVRPGFLYRRV
ncbi:hypothetical protein V6N13_106255 [Hibiscus sabdariffa]|uniref:Uncharacterized protein n=1 Tax=Hibiscus sabdariffa TaxID=183260 RepID=A0ABR2F058_9ROSI